MERALAVALGTNEPGEIAAVVTALEALAQHLTPEALARIRADLSGHHQEEDCT